MPGGFPTSAAICNGTDQGADTSTSKGTTVTGGAGTANGSYTQLVASTSIDASWVFLRVRKRTTVAVNNGSISLAIGAAASEVDIIPDIPLVLAALTSQAFTSFLIPISIPAGTRLSIRARGADTYECAVILFDASYTTPFDFSGADVIGVSSPPVATQVTASGSTNTKGSYAQLVASTSRDYSGVVLHIGPPNAATMFDADYLVDIAIGAAASEQVVIPNMAFGGDASYHSYSWFFPIEIPAGTRIAARIQCSTASKVLGIAAHGLYQ